MARAVGIDVSKDWLDVAIDRRNWRVRNTREGVPKDAGPVVLVASGGFEACALGGLFDAGLQVVLVQPGRARYFAKATGQLAKTDTIDARLLAHMGESLGDPLRRWAHTRPVQQDPRALVQRRRQLVNYRDDERPLVAASIERIKADIKVVEACIVELVAQDPSTSQDVAVLESTVGVGWVTAVTLLALLVA